MKMKLLALLLTMGLFAFGTGVSAQNAAQTETAAEREANAKLQLPNLQSALKSFCGLILSESHPKACADACANLANPKWADLNCCISAAKSFGALPENLETLIGGISKVGCLGGIFGYGATCGDTGASAIVTNICGSLNCNTKFDDVSNCLSVAKKSCSSDFALDPKCVVCTGKCCPDKNKNYCTNDVCTANKGVCPAKPCTTDAECKFDQSCVSGKCQAAAGKCTDNDECDAGQVCIKGKCGACTKDGQCDEGEACVKGQCTIPPQCTKNADCLAGEVCTKGECTACTADAQCDKGQKCVKGLCKASSGGCTKNSDCSSGKACINKQCAACTKDGQCDSGKVCTNGQCTAPSGKCSPACNAAIGETCVKGKCAVVCNTTCAAGETCRFVKAQNKNGCCTSGGKCHY